MDKKLQLPGKIRAGS